MSAPEDLPELAHEFTEHKPERVHDGYVGKEVGSGSVACARCGLVLPTLHGKIMPSWQSFIDGIDCAERLIDIVHLL